VLTIQGSDLRKRRCKIVSKAKVFLSGEGNLGGRRHGHFLSKNGFLSALALSALVKR